MKGNTLNINCLSLETHLATPEFSPFSADFKREIRSSAGVAEDISTCIAEFTTQWNLRR